MISSAHSTLAAMNGKISFTETVDCGSVSLTDIFRRARLWVEPGCSDNKTLVSDKDTGDLIHCRDTLHSRFPARRIQRAAFTGSATFFPSNVPTASTGYRLPMWNSRNDQRSQYRAGSFQPEIEENKAAAAELDIKLKGMLAELQADVKIISRSDNEHQSHYNVPPRSRTFLVADVGVVLLVIAPQPATYRVGQCPARNHGMVCIAAGDRRIVSSFDLVTRAD